MLLILPVLFWILVSVTDLSIPIGIAISLHCCHSYYSWYSFAFGIAFGIILSPASLLWSQVDPFHACLFSSSRDKWSVGLWNVWQRYLNTWYSSHLFTRNKHKHKKQISRLCYYCYDTSIRSFIHFTGTQTASVASTVLWRNRKPAYNWSKWWTIRNWNR